MDTILTIFNYAALGVAGIAFMNNCREAREIRQTSEKMLNCESHELGRDDKLDENKPYNRMAYVQLPPFQANITRDTFIKRRQSVPITEVQADDHRLLYGQCGNSFNCTISNKKLRVQMNQCNIDKRALDKQVQPIKLHENHNYTYYNITYTLKTTIGLGLIGSLRYNIEARQFVLEPLFLAELKSKREIMAIVAKFYDQKLTYLFFKRVFCCIAIGFLFVTAFYRTFGGRKGQEPSGGNKMERIQTRASERLKCECGQNMNVVSECGHLSMCKKCLQKDSKCKICGKNIRHPRIIFI